MDRTSNLSNTGDADAAGLGNNATEGTPSRPQSSQSLASIRTIAEREVNARLKQLEVMSIKETEILAIKEKEAILSLAVKEKEMAVKELELLNVKETGDLKKHILEAELKMKETMLEHMLKGKTQ